MTKNEIVLRYLCIKSGKNWLVSALILGFVNHRGKFIEYAEFKFDKPITPREVSTQPLSLFFKFQHTPEELSGVTEKEHNDYERRGLFPKMPILKVLNGGKRTQKNERICNL